MARDGDLRKAHSTPLIVKNGDSFLMLSTGAKASYGYDPKDGRELWQVRFSSWSAAPVPVYQDGLSYLVTGFGKTELWAVRVNGSGNVTDSHVAWKYENQVAKTASPILVSNLLYMVSDEGIVTCVAPDSGKQVWRERIGGKYSASPVFADGHLFFCSMEGKTTVLNPGPAFQPVSTNLLAAGFMASPAVAENALILRTRTHLYRVAQAAAKPSAAP
jgi:outer membrane protein assembly factor BamB